MIELRPSIPHLSIAVKTIASLSYDEVLVSNLL